jgi:type IV secretory pathway VirB3-like protein
MTVFESITRNIWLLGVTLSLANLGFSCILCAIYNQLKRIANALEAKK